jgi:hypothetical protein
MIVGKYAVNPNHVIYASKRFDPDCGKVEITIFLDDDTPLSQWVSKDDEVDRLFALADKACDASEDVEKLGLAAEEE